MRKLESHVAAQDGTWSPEDFTNTLPNVLKKGRFTYAAVLGLAMLAAVSAQAGNVRVLHAFTGPPDGATPSGVLILDAAGNFYGTTSGGGVYNYGTVFEIDNKGEETVLYSFRGKRNGSAPQGIVQDADGNFYGTTENGGTYRFGTVFKLTPTGKFTVLHSFSGSPDDGEFPEAPPILDVAGNLYGTTTDGGSGTCYNGCGIVYELNGDGTYSVIHNFVGYPTDGQSPNTPLLEDAQGNLYGTTFIGGNSACSNDTPGCGTVFMLTTAGTETILHSFIGSPKDGDEPSGGLSRDEKGNLFGTTVNGGRFGYGNVFKLNPEGKEITLTSFGSDGSDAEYPSSSVVRDSAGNLYGTTQYGGQAGCSGAGCGTVFELSRAGLQTVLSAFNVSDGAVPTAGLILGPSGKLYGVTPSGGASGFGVVFELAP
ncbi:MAG TPA: choice-of-anchor tandem repeat GloVer-containing protein [Terriglobales bacterium]|jgi:uncharacterized repeat protein (TIGR03803 family)|nr:choice-of-anchor tandem repeat GloVer-containing protein [Terriglobales bacterium]